MKKFAILFVLISALFLISCDPNDPIGGITPGGDENDDVTEITLWSYPIGEWNDNVNVSALLTAFNSEHQDIRVVAKAIDYTSGDSEVEKAIASGEAPDIIFEGPERLVANWGAKGLMADLNDLFEDSDLIYDNVKAACKNNDGKYYVYPICMTTHCMAVNRDLFEKANAMQYIDEETHTWTTDDFIAAVNALNAYIKENGPSDGRVATIYCSNQGGDQGTRALVTNLYGGKFTNAEHTEYTVNSPENIKALKLLKSLEGIDFDPTIAGSDEISLFGNGKLAMSFCWNVSAEISQIKNNVNFNFDVIPMTFPTEKKEDSTLQGGIWGMGIFDNGDEKKIEAAKLFIEYLVKNKNNYKEAVLATGFWPVRTDMNNIYVNDYIMNEYSFLSGYLGDYYQVTSNWANARYNWWNMLQSIDRGEDVETAVQKFFP